MTTKLRLFAGGTALAAGLLFFSGVTAAPALPPDTYKKVAEADVALLKQHLKMLADSPTDPNIKGHHRTARTLSMMLAYYGETIGDKALRDQALKVAEELEKVAKAVRKTAADRAKDGSNTAIAATGKAAGELAAKLAPKPGAKALSPTPLHTMHKFDLEELMGPFRRGEDKAAGKHYGGMNIEKDIKDVIKKDAPVKVDPAAAELLAARTAVLGEFTLQMPTDKAATGAGKADWDKWTKDMIEQSQKLAAEAAKGKGADEKAMVKLMNAIDTKCKECHNKFRDE